MCMCVCVYVCVYVCSLYGGGSRLFGFASPGNGDSEMRSALLPSIYSIVWHCICLSVWCLFAVFVRHGIMITPQDPCLFGKDLFLCGERTRESVRE
ncbi:hypothetical protein DFP73DRAFT_547049 [Morchella snyderi]|nr:hypothetical protein DFP73DRAFT_547049 [Morchella snyderi]